MGFRLATAAVEFTAKDRGLKAGLAGIGRGLSKLKSLALGIGGPLLAAFAVGASIAGAIEQQLSEARLAAVLAQTGEAAGFAFDELTKLASALQEIGIIGDEAVIQAEAILATFTNIRGEIFLRTLIASLNEAALKGTKAADVAIQFAKAVNDPVKGVASLQRIGIAFTKEQIKQLKNLQAQGKLFEAQRLVLETIESNLGDINVAIGRTPVGKLIQLKNILGDIAEQLGIGLAEGFQDAFESLAQFASALAPVLRAVGKIIAQIVSFIINTISKGANALAQAFGFDNIEASAEQLAAFLEITFLQIQKGFVTAAQLAVKGAQLIVASIGLVSIELTELKNLVIEIGSIFLGTIGKSIDGIIEAAKNLKVDDEGVNAFTKSVLDQLDVLSEGLDSRSNTLEKQIAGLKLLFAGDIIAGRAKSFLESLGLITKEKPEVKITIPDIPGAKKAGKAAGLQIEGVEETFKRIQAEITDRAKDPVAAQKETTKAVADVKESVDAAKAAQQTSSKAVVDAIGKAFSLESILSPGEPR